jgi:hypothetical protein
MLNKSDKKCLEISEWIYYWSNYITYYQNLLYSECQKFGIMEIRMYFLPVELFEKNSD